ncbi:MAG: hypothetical protein R2867_11685 [Caldilineaceae bacterium]
MRSDDTARSTGLGSYILGDVFLWGPLMATAMSSRRCRGDPLYRGAALCGGGDDAGLGEGVVV